MHFPFGGSLSFRLISALTRTVLRLPEATLTAVGVSPPCPLAGTFMVARMLCRSLSWMGCVGLAAPTAREDTAGEEGVVAVGEAAEVAEGVMGVVGTWEEPSRLAAEVEVGVTAVDGLKGEREKICSVHLT